MKTNVLMTTASTAALVVGGAQTALAQEGILPEGYTLNVQGGYGLINNVLLDKIEDADFDEEEIDELTDKIGDEDSYRQISGSFSLSRELAPGRDVSLGVSGSLTVEDSVSTSEESGGETQTLETQNRFSYTAVDLDMGYTLPTAAADVRAFVGLRAMASKAELEKLGEIESGGVTTFDESIGFTGTFKGIGPRLGVGFETQQTPVGTAGSFSLSGELAASYLFGSREDEAFQSFSAGSEVSESYDLEVSTLEAQLGVNYHLSPGSKITVGYELQQFWNVDGFSDVDNDRAFDEVAQPRLIQGAFIGFTTQF